MREIGVEIHQLGGVNDAASSDSKKCIWLVIL